MIYDKVPLTSSEHIQVLQQRGLKIDDPARATKYLERVGYYRLTGYMFHLQSQDGQHIFNEGTTFDDIILHYQFDKKLRHLVLEYIERIEVALRTLISDRYSLKHGFLWYTQNQLYGDTEVCNQITNYLTAYFDNPTEIFLRNFKAKYTSETFPPSNMAMETLTFGKVSKLYAGLKNEELKQGIAKEFNMPSNILTSWLIHLTNIRNICAHHSRLWNKRMTADRPLLPSREIYKFKGSVPNDFNMTFYGGAAIIIRLLSAINPQNSFERKLVELIDAYPSVDKASMGFPADWRENPAWK